MVIQLSNYHLLGTNSGEDVLYVSLKSVRTGLLIGALSIFYTTFCAHLVLLRVTLAVGWMM